MSVDQLRPRLAVVDAVSSLGLDSGLAAQLTTHVRTPLAELARRHLFVPTETRPRIALSGSDTRPNQLVVGMRDDDGTRLELSLTGGLVFDTHIPDLGSRVMDIDPDEVAKVTAQLWVPRTRRATLTYRGPDERNLQPVGTVRDSQFDDARTHTTTGPDPLDAHYKVMRLTGEIVEKFGEDA